MTNHTQSLKKAVQEFQTLQKNYRSYGADDSEPDGIFQELLLDYKESQVPQSGDDWALYTNSMKCEHVAKKLSDSATNVLNVARGCPPDQVSEMEKYIKEYCWRC